MRIQLFLGAFFLFGEYFEIKAVYIV